VGSSVSSIHEFSWIRSSRFGIGISSSERQSPASSGYRYGTIDSGSSPGQRNRPDGSAVAVASKRNSRALQHLVPSPREAVGAGQRLFENRSLHVENRAASWRRRCRRTDPGWRAGKSADHALTALVRVRSSG
jgi:hypothetical protein